MTGGAFERDGARSRGASLAKRRDLIARLAANADFREWLYGELDNLCAFDGVAAQLSEFGQGIRATAHEIVERLLVAGEGAQMMADFAARNFKARHEGFVRAAKNNTTEAKR